MEQKKKAEDLIDKLPGISVNKISGEITYKGKVVETVMLGGDDLFGGNYAIGTKNISVDMIEEVQAIENYSKNRLLKGIEDSEKVILNLKLKEKKTDYSGTVMLSNGYGENLMYNDETTLIGVSSKIKSFGVITFNNVGSTIKDILDNAERRTAKVFDQSYLTSTELDDSPRKLSLPANRANFNSSIFGNYNVIYKLSKKLSIKNNLFVIRDRLNFTEDIENKYFTNNIITTTVRNFINTTNYYRLDNNIIYSINDKSQLLINANLKRTKIESLNTISQNSENNYFAKYLTNNYLYNLSADYTLKLNDTAALEWKNVLSHNAAPQSLSSTPNNASITQIEADNSRQDSQFSKEFFASILNLHSNFKGFKTILIVGFIKFKSPFNSKLVEDVTLNSNFFNHQDYQLSKFFIAAQNSFNYKKFKYSQFVAIDNYQLKLNDYYQQENKSNNMNFVNYSGFITYNIDKYSHFYFNTSLNFKPPNENVLFEQNVILNNTTIAANFASLNFIRSVDLSGGYNFNRLIKNLSFTAGFNYSEFTNMFVNKIDINQNFIKITNFQPDNKIINKGVLFSFEKHSKRIRTLFKYNFSFSQSSYVNAVNNFDLRANNSKDFATALFFSTFFDFPVNVSNKFSYNWMEFTNSEKDKSTVSSLSNAVKLNFNVNENIILSVIHDYYLPNFNAQNQFSFLDLSLQYKSEKIKWLKFNIYGRNLLNSNTFTQVVADDFSIENYKSKLIPRYFLISTDFSF